MSRPDPVPMPVLLRADARSLPLADDSVDLIVTSPPYWGLRAYLDGGEHYEGQVGDELTPWAYLDELLACTREMVRVLKPSGSIFVNLGDRYSIELQRSYGTKAEWSLSRTQRAASQRGGEVAAARFVSSAPRAWGVPRKSLMLLPERYRIRCVDELQLIARQVIVWCLSGGARVYARTPTGDRPVMLRDLARAYRPEDVMLWNGERWTQVLGWNRTLDDDGALELELRTGERIGCTPNHQWPTGRGLLRAAEIRVGDIIETTRLPEPEVPRTPALLPDDDIGWLVGLYLAEGSRSETTIQFAGHVNETARHARLARIAEALDGTCAVYQTSENGVTCNLHGSVLVGVVNRYVSAGTAMSKRLRRATWQRSDAFLAAVVGGYLSGDGHYDAKNDRWRLGFTANDEWAADLRTLAARLGAALKLRRAEHVMAGRRFPGWRGEWRWTRSTHHNAKPDGEVVAIRRSRARDFYDLGVADAPHVFALASGVLTHNSKPNGMPENVPGRCRRSHEDWVHLTKRETYYSDIDPLRSTHVRRWTQGRNGGFKAARGALGHQYDGLSQAVPHAAGSLPRSVWEIPTQPFVVPDHIAHARCCDIPGSRSTPRPGCTDGLDHHAAFPMEWPRRLILGWCPPGGVVLDPFGGTGCAALVATMLGRTGISVDLSADYGRLARWRASDPKERGRAAGLSPDKVAAIPVVSADQGVLDLGGVTA